jgi:hypothetical protein
LPVGKVRSRLTKLQQDQQRVRGQLKDCRARPGRSRQRSDRCSASTRQATAALPGSRGARPPDGCSPRPFSSASTSRITTSPRSATSDPSDAGACCCRDQGLHPGWLMLFAGPGPRARTHRRGNRRAFFGGDDVTADETVEAGQLPAGRRRCACRNRARRRVEGKLLGKVLRAVPVQSNQPLPLRPSAWHTDHMLAINETVNPLLPTHDWSTS